MNIKEKFDLTGHVAVVTGGVGLLGAEFCKTLAEAGASVAVVDLNASASQETADLKRETPFAPPSERHFYIMQTPASFHPKAISMIQWRIFRPDYIHPAYTVTGQNWRVFLPRDHSSVPHTFL